MRLNGTVYILPYIFLIYLLNIHNITISSSFNRDEKDVETCNQYKEKYNIKIDHSWGSAPNDIQIAWESMDCNSLTSISGQDIAAGNFTKKPIIKLHMHDKVTGFLNWLQDWFVQYARDNCNTFCLISSKKRKIHDADVVLYHAKTHSAIVSSTGKKRALHILISLEQPNYAPILNDKEKLGKFDALATYSMKPLFPGTTITNIPLSYYSLEFMNVSSIFKLPRPFKDKTGYDTGVNVTVFVSNCKNAGASERYQYLEDLMKYITVHSYGRCFHNIDEPEIPDDPIFNIIGQRRSRKTKIISNYKFYLSFENYAIEDYVSEKVYEGLFAGAVPVYRGTNTIYNFMPSNDSFINANDMTPKELASLLTLLSSNEEEYNKFMRFKNDSISKRFEDITSKSYTHPNAACRICDYAYEMRNKSENNKIT